MSKNTIRLVISDLHFGHHSCYNKFVNEKGASIRPWAKDANEGDERIIEAWNGVVEDHHRVYLLGDVNIPRSALKKAGRLNGKIVLIRGNHDIMKLKEYREFFVDVRGTTKVGNCILSHYPIHSSCIPEWCKYNIHGHTHQNDVMVPLLSKNCDPGSKTVSIKDGRYINVCVEKLKDQKPILIDSIDGFSWN